MRMGRQLFRTLQRYFTREEVNKYVSKLKDRKAARAAHMVIELMKYGGAGMLAVMVTLYNWIWKSEYALKTWREGGVVKLSKKGDEADPERHNAYRRKNVL